MRTLWLIAVLDLIVCTQLLIAACAPSATQAPALPPSVPKQPAAPAPAAAPQVPAAAPAPAPKPTDQKSTAVKPKRGGRLVVSQSDDAASLDPLASQAYTVPERISLVYPRLIDYKKDSPQDDFSASTPKPGWATDRWEFSPDGKKLTFHLKRGVKYPNLPPVNGRELTSEDVRFSIWRYKTNPVSAFKPRYEDIESADTPDKYTVVFNLKRPTAYVLYALAAEPSFITPPEIEKAQGDYKQLLVGAGPFIHEKTISGEGSTFKRNPDYFEADAIYLDQIIFKVIPDKATRIAALRAGQADWVGRSGFTRTELDTLLKTNPDMKYQGAITGISGIWYNMKNPLFQDLRVRKGLSKAVDLQEIIDRTQEGQGIFQTVVPQGFGKWALPEKEVRKLDAYTYDVAAAKRLLKEAGFNIKTIKVYLRPGAGTEGVFAPVWEKELGIKLEYSTDVFSTFFEKCYNNKFDDICLGGLQLFDPIDFLRAQYYTGGPRNGPGLDDPKVNAKINDIVGTLDEGQRLKKVLDFQRYVSEEVLSMLHLPGRASYWPYQPWLRDFMPAMRPPGSEWIIHAWIDK